MQTTKLLTSEFTRCIRCYLRFGKNNSLQLALPSSIVCSTPYWRRYSIDAIPTPSFENEAKRYAPKIQKLVQDISQLTLIEVADLNELLKKTLNIADAPVMSMGAMAASRQTQEEVEPEPAKVVQTAFTVKLIKFDEAKKVAVIKEIKSLVPGLNLVQAKKFVESLPQPVKVDATKEEAEKLKTALAAVGATVEIV